MGPANLLGFRFNLETIMLIPRCSVLLRLQVGILVGRCAPGKDLVLEALKTPERVGVNALSVISAPGRRQLECLVDTPPLFFLCRTAQSR